jgi:hypothetical protein
MRINVYIAKEIQKFIKIFYVLLLVRMIFEKKKKTSIRIKFHLKRLVLYTYFKKEEKLEVLETR